MEKDAAERVLVAVMYHMQRKQNPGMEKPGHDRRLQIWGGVYRRLPSEAELYTALPENSACDGILHQERGAFDPVKSEPGAECQDSHDGGSEKPD